jgi:hypothetical protein
MLSGKLRKGGAMGNIETTPEDKVRARIEICKESERPIAVKKTETKKEEKAGL